MAKLAFTKLGLKPNNEIKTVEFNGQVIEVKQYLPVEEKLKLIASVLEFSHDQNNFSNPVKVSVYTALEIIEKYTNMNFTDKQKENPTKLYDLLFSNGLIHSVIENIPQEEYDVLIKGIYDTIEAVYKYQNSVLGILEAIVNDYQNVQFDLEGITNKLTDSEQIATLKELAQASGLFNNE